MVLGLFPSLFCFLQLFYGCCSLEEFTSSCRSNICNQCANSGTVLQLVRGNLPSERSYQMGSLSKWWLKMQPMLQAFPSQRQLPANNGEGFCRSYSTIQDANTPHPQSCIKEGQGRDTHLRYRINTPHRSVCAHTCVRSSGGGGLTSCSRAQSVNRCCRVLRGLGRGGSWVRWAFRGPGGWTVYSCHRSLALPVMSRWKRSQHSNWRRQLKVTCMLWKSNFHKFYQVELQSINVSHSFTMELPAGLPGL